MVDVNTIIGEPIQTSNGTVIIPISKVSFGFAAGGSEFNGEALNEYTKNDKDEAIQYSLPFGGGSGAGVSINPVAFLVVSQNSVKLLPVSHTSAIDKLLDYVPDLMEKANLLINKNMQNKKEEKAKEPVTSENKKAKEEKIKETIMAESVPKAKIRRTKRPIIEYEYDETDDEDSIIEEIMNEDEEK